MRNLIVSIGLILSTSTASAFVMTQPPVNNTPSVTYAPNSITYEYRDTNAGVDTSDYRQSWNNQTSTIFSRDLDAFTNVRTDDNWEEHSHLNITFDVADSAAGLDWWFEFSPDAGYGGEIYFDGILVDRDTNNLWWNYSWNNSAELLTAYINDLDAGSHRIDMYWAENCCNGNQSGRFSVDNGANWYALSNENLSSVDVSEPGSLALLGLGIIGLAATRMKQRS